MKNIFLRHKILLKTSFELKKNFSSLDKKRKSNKKWHTITCIYADFFKRTIKRNNIKKKVNE